MIFNLILKLKKNEQCLIYLKTYILDIDNIKKLNIILFNFFIKIKENVRRRYKQITNSKKTISRRDRCEKIGIMFCVL